MKKLTSITVSFLLCCITVFSQKLQITGTVTNADDGIQLPGVTITIKGTTKGFITDTEGNYKIDVQPNDTLIFSSLGMLDEEIVVGNENVIDIVLKTKFSDLDEVIVVGYGTASRASFVGSATVVKTGDIDDDPVSSFDKSLQGLVPGLLTSSGSGMPGSSTDIILRGVGSINASTDPLYIVDGIPIASGITHSYYYVTNPLTALEPSDIESISVLKDASATSIYGARASNGVILITTKKGRSGKLTLEFNTQLGNSYRAADNFEVLNAAEYKELMYEQFVNAGVPEYEAYTRIEEMGVKDINWVDEIFKKGFDQRYNLKASGGNERSSFYISGNYRKQDGMIISSGMERYSARTNFDYQASEMIKIGVNSTLTYSEVVGTLGAGYYSDPVTSAFFMPPIHSPYNDDGSFNQDIPELEDVNSIADAALNNFGFKQKRYLFNFYADVKPLKGLSYKFNAGGDFFNMGEDYYQSPLLVPGIYTKGRAVYADIERFHRIITNTINYNFNKGLHDIGILIGQEAQKTHEFRTQLSGINFPSEKFETLASASQAENVFTSINGTALASFFSGVNYSFNKKYNLGVTARADGSSRFGKNNRWAGFGSVGVSWRVTEEEFMSSIAFIDDIKLRASFGTSGNQEIVSFGDRGRIYNDYYTSLGLYSYGADYNGQPGSQLYQLPNPNLRWEQNQTTNIGLDFVTLHGRLNGTIDLYQKNTKDLIMWVPVSSATGLTGVMDNVGAMQNRGVEVALNSLLINRTFKWKAGINFTANKNKVTKLNDDEPFNIDNLRQRAEVGHPLRSYYLVRWAGVNPADGSALWLDADGNPVMNYADAEKVLLDQKADPDFYGGFTSSFSYKSVELSLNFYGVYGNSIYNVTDLYLRSDGIARWNTDRRQLDRWTKPGDDASSPIRVDGASSGIKESTRQLEDGSYLRLKNITLSYVLPKKFSRIIRTETLRIYAMTENPYTWTNFSGWDPETALNGKWFFNYPIARTYSVGIDLTF